MISRQVAWPLPALQRAGMLLALLIAALPVLQQLLSWMTTGRTLYWLLDESAYDTLRLASGWLNGGDYSFNGVEPSNGFQPLWMLLVTVLGLISGGEPEAFFLVFISALALINMATLYWFRHLYRDRLGAGLAWLVPLFLLILFPAVVARGAETVLALPLLYFLLQRLTAGAEVWTQRGCWQVGIAMALLFLTRLDSLVLMPLLVAWVAWQQRSGLRHLAALMLPVAVALAGYALVNLACFGQIMPVSLQALSAGTPGGANFSVYGDVWSWLMKPGIAALALIWLLVELACRHQRAPGHDFAALVFCLVAVLLQAGLYAWLSGWALLAHDGYLVMAVVLAVVLRVHALTASPSGAVLRGGRLLLRRLLFMVLLFGSAAGLPAWGDQAADGSVARNQRDIEAGVFKGKTLIMSEHAGSVGFWVPSARIARPEGLTMSPGFIASKQAGKGVEWIDRHYEVDELVVDRPWLPTMHHGGDRVYLVVEPVRARLWQDRAMVYCFPQFAVLDESHGDNYSRLRFAYAERMTCPAPLMAWANDVNYRAQLFLLSAALRPEGVARSLNQLDHWLASRQRMPQPVEQPDMDLE